MKQHEVTSADAANSGEVPFPQPGLVSNSDPKAISSLIGARRNSRGRDWERLWERFGIGTLLLICWLIAALTLPNFAQFDNINSILRQSSFIGISAVGMTLAIIAGNFDLSVGSTLGLCAWVGVLVASHAGVVPAILAALLCGIMVGAINGVLISIIRIPAFIATLGMLFVVQGFTFVITNGETARYNGADFVVLGNGDLLGVPIPFVIFVVCALIGVCILSYTPLGRYIFAIGSNKETALVVGVPIRLTIFSVFILVSLFTALAAFLLGARLYSAGAGLEPGFELNVIATVVLGGTRLAGGRGSMLGTIAAAILFATIGNVLNLIHTDAFVQRLAIGVVLLLALSIEGLRQRLAERLSHN